MGLALVVTLIAVGAVLAIGALSADVINIAMFAAKCIAADAEGSDKVFRRHLVATTVIGAGVLLMILSSILGREQLQSITFELLMYVGG